MNLLVPDRSYTDFDGDRSELAQDIADAVADLGGHELSEADIGPGADWPMFTVALTAIGSVFLLGERIERSLDAWVALSRKVTKAIARLKAKHGAIRVDEAGARLLVLERLSRSVQRIDTLEVLVADTVPIHEFSDRPKGELGSRYDALFVLVIRINDAHLYVAGVRSSGEIDFLQVYGAHFMTFGAPESRDS